MTFDEVFVILKIILDKYKNFKIGTFGNFIIFLTSFQVKKNVKLLFPASPIVTNRIPTTNKEKTKIPSLKVPHGRWRRREGRCCREEGGRRNAFGKKKIL